MPLRTKPIVTPQQKPLSTGSKLHKLHQLCPELRYQSDWRNFCAWCEARNVGALPSIPETVASYIAECAGHLKSSVFSGGGTPLPKRNKVARLDSPKHTAIVRNTMKGYPADSRNRAGSKSANADGRSPRLGGRRRRGASSARATVR